MAINTNRLIISSGTSEDTPYITGITQTSGLTQNYENIVPEGYIKDYVDAISTGTVSTDTYLTATTFDSESYELTNELSDDTTVTADLSPLSANTYLTASTLNTSTYQLTNELNDGTEIVVSLSDIIQWEKDTSGIRMRNNGGISIGENSISEGVETRATAFGSHAEGFRTEANGDYSHAEGIYSYADGDSSHSGGKGFDETYRVSAEGISSFNHSTTEDGFVSNASGNYSAILGGKNNNVTGEGSIILGGDRITGTSDYTTYVDNLNIDTTPTNDDTLTQILVRDDITGDIKYKSTASLTSTSIVSGDYNEITGVVTFENSTGGTFDISGFTTGLTNSYTTNAYLNGNEIRFDNNVEGSNYYNVDLSSIKEWETGNIYSDGVIIKNTIKPKSVDYIRSKGYLIGLSSNDLISGFTKNTLNTSKYDIASNYAINDAIDSSINDAIYLTNGFGSSSIIVKNRNNEASGNFSNAFGYNSTADGNYSHTEGYETTAGGQTSHAEGRQTTASGDHSHTEGYLSVASGEDSHAEGYETTASGPKSHAEGDGTLASGEGSHAEGIYTLASGDGSHASGKGDIGNRVLASGYASFNHSISTATGGIVGASGTGSAILGGSNQIASGANSAILGGSYNDTNNKIDSVIIGCNNVTATEDIMVYVPRIEVKLVGEGIVMSSPNGTRYNITVTDGGSLNVTAL